LLRLTRRVPVATVIIDTPAGIAEHFGIVDAVTAEHGLVTSEMLPAALLRDGTHCRGGLSLGRHRY
jgi:PII-like signaling protein